MCLGLWSVPLLLFRRLWITLGAWNDLRHGRLRQGILFGPEGLLVRLESNRCYPVPLDRFVVARRFPPEAARDTRTPRLIIDTRDGTVEFFVRRLAAGPDDINRCVGALRPSWSKPEPVEHPNRAMRADTRTRRQLRDAAVLAGISVLRQARPAARSPGYPTWMMT